MHLASQENLCAKELVIPEKRKLNLGLETKHAV